MDSRFYLTVKFSIYGKDYEWDASLNWSDNGEGLDQRIADFFRDAHDEAYRLHQDAIWQAQKNERKAKEEQSEREELARLQAKYGATP